MACLESKMKKNILIHSELLKGDRLFADGAQPLRPLLLELQVRGGIKALDVRTVDTAARAFESPIRDRAFEAEIQ